MGLNNFILNLNSDSLAENKNNLKFLSEGLKKLSSLRKFTLDLNGN